jgi:glutamyl-tRNA synthetase
MSRQELVEAFSFEGINRSNAVVNFQENDPVDPKAVWLNSAQIRALPVEELAARLLPFACASGFKADLPQMLRVTPLIQERIRLLSEVATAADFFFVRQLAPYDAAELIPQKGDAKLALTVLERAHEVLAGTEFTHDALEQALRGAAGELKIKAGQMFQPVRVAVCGRKNAPPLFETLAVVGRDATLERIEQAIGKLRQAA